jgi:hypothetical protein
MSRRNRTYHATGLGQVHRTRVVRHAGLEAKVDVQLAPLVHALWRAGVYTLMSCQNFDGRAWIVFLTRPAAEYFRRVCRPRGLEVRRTPIPELWSLGTVYHALFPSRERHAALRRLNAALGASRRARTRSPQRRRKS